MLQDLLLKNENGAVLIVSIFIILVFQLLVKVGEFSWKLFQKKNELSEQTTLKLMVSLEANTKACEKLDARIQEAEEMIAEFPKLKKDLQRLFSALKKVAGPQWAEIRKEMLEDDI